MAIVFLNGKYVDERKAFVSIYDMGFLYGEGVYETLRTVEGKIANVDLHLKRLAGSAKLLKFPLPSRVELAKWLQTTVDRNGFWKKGQESYVRLTVTGGVHDRGKDSHKPTILITVMRLPVVSNAVVERGVPVISYEIERVLPQAKTTNFLPAIVARRAMRKANAYEVLLVDRHGHVTEGSVTNILLVKGGRLITPELEMLGGTTRERILKLARRLKIKVEKRSIKLKAVYAADEVFVCNAPRGIVPVVKVDGKKIGRGKVGEVTQRLMDGL